MQCEEHVPNAGAYWLATRIVLERCRRIATCVIYFRPPKPGDDGGRRMCDLCAKSYVGYKLEPL